MDNIGKALQYIGHAIRHEDYYISSLEYAVHFLTLEINKAKRIEKRTKFLASLDWRGKTDDIHE